MNEKFWYLKNCPLFRQLTPEQIRGIEAACFAREFQRGEFIYLPSDMGDSILLLARGRVRIYHVTPEGKQAILGFVEPGELFGELSVFDEHRREEYAEAADKCFVVLMPRHVMQHVMAENPDISLGMTRLFGFRLRRIERRLKSLLFRSSRDRLIHLLLELAEKYGRRQPDGLLIAMKISHQDLASVIGATRETVTITLGELQQEGMVEIQRRRVVLKRVEDMTSLVDFGPLRLAAAV
ncbi:MAG: Crp/Fnr family transcriptional regulator [Planctomycetaceae bacterium]